ncbi:MAG: response regulator [Deltaproteobacteria bacterium]|nr:response regulator [Deltaproteobacteria bacterium]
MSRIMIVDDDVIIAEELKEILISDGYQVIKVIYSADEAITLAGILRPDLILMDIHFQEGLDGITAVRKIRVELDIPVMFVTGHSGLEIVERAKDLEPLGYVVKPFHEAQVASNVRLAFNQIKIDKELAEARGRLEDRVRERTEKLAKANRRLKNEIRERKLAQEALAQSEGHLRSLMENAENFVVYRLAHDETAPILLRVVFVSPSIVRLMGVSDPMDYESWFENIHPEDLQRMMDANSKAWETHRFNEKMRIFHPEEKTWKWIHAISNGTRIENGRAKYINGLMVDITREMAFEEALKKRDGELKEKAIHLEEANTALRVLLRKRDQDKLEFEKRILANVKMLIEPHMEYMKNCNLSSSQKEQLSMLERSLKEIISPFSRRLTSTYVGLTPGELEVAYLVKEGKRTKDIAEILNLSDKTIEDYRKQLRTKLGIKNKRVNLRTHLMTLQ